LTKLRDSKNKEHKDIAKIYKGLSEVKRAIWIGNGNLLLASQQAEEERKQDRR